jgi:hypothetical protein
MQNEVRRQHLFEGGAEGSDEHGRKVGYKAHRVGQNDFAAVRQLDFAHGRVERGEQEVFRHDTAVGELVEQGRFAGVGIAHKGHDRIRDTRSALAMQGTRALDALQLGFDAGNPLLYQTAVDFELRLAGAAEKPETTSLALKMSPGSHEPALLILQVSKLDLQRAFARVGALTENLEDKAGAVQYLGPPGLLQVPLLDGRELGIDDDELGVFLRHQFAERVHLAFAEQCVRVYDGQRDHH